MGHQRNDPELLKLINNITHNLNNIENNKFKTFRNKLRIENGILKLNSHGQFLYIVPTEMRKELMSILIYSTYRDAERINVNSYI